MLLKIFKRSSANVIFLILLIAVLVWLSSFLHPLPPDSMNYNIKPMPLFALMLRIAGFNTLTSVLVTFLTVLFIAFLLVNFNTTDFFIGERTFLPALFYVMLSGLFPSLQVLNPVLPAAIFLIFVTRKIMNSYKVQGTAFTYFDAGLLISIGTLFYCNLIWFGFLLIVGIALLRSGDPKEIIISILGLITPWFLVFGIYYITGRDISSLLSDIRYNLFSREIQFKVSLVSIIILAIPGLILIISAVHLYSVINSKKIKSHKTFNLLFWIFIIAAVVYFLFKSISMDIIWLTGIPISYFLSHYFVFARKKLIPRILFPILFVVVALMQLLQRV